MNTDDLIRQLASDTRPVSRNSVARRLAIGIVAGGIASALLILASIGVRPDLGTAMQGASFWVKWGYTFSLSIAALMMTAQLARPDSGRLRGLWALGIPVLLLASPVGSARRAWPPAGIRGPRPSSRRPGHAPRRCSDHDRRAR